MGINLFTCMNILKWKQFKLIRILSLLVGICAMIFACSSKGKNISVEVPQSNGPSMKGVCWVGGDSIAIHNFDQLLQVGGNWISQTPFGWQPQYDKPDIRLNNDRAWWGEADRGLAHTTKLAKQKGIKTILKPHIWLRTDGKWRSDIEMESKQEWEAWFQNYEVFIMHYAKLAQELDIEALCIGTELYITTRDHPEKWRSIIKNIRAVYDGQITYAANWYKEYEEITFWDDLDFIGIQGYFPLSTKDNPSKQDVIKGWAKHKKRIQKISEKYNKKVVFTEIGFKNTADSAKEPWTWPQQLDNNTVVKSDETQVMCYEAMFEALWHEPWVDGFFIWKWFHTTYRHEDFAIYFKERQARRDSFNKARNRRSRPQVYFTPQHTEALQVLSKWYSSEEP